MYLFSLENGHACDIIIDSNRWYKRTRGIVHMRKILPAACLIVTLILVALNVATLFQWISNWHAGISSIAAFAAVAVLFALVVYALLKTGFIMAIRHGTTFAVILFAVSLLLKTVFVLLIKTPQYSDFQLFYWVTAEIGSGNPKYLSEDYFSIWAYQTGFPAAMSVFYGIFGQNILAYIILNCVFLSISNVLVYLIAGTFTSEKISRIVALLYLFFPYIFGLSSVYTNQHLATMLFYCGIYVFLKRKKSLVLMPLAAGALIALGNAIRPEGIIFAGSFGACLFFEFLSDLRLHIKEWKHFIKKHLLPTATVIASFFLCFSLVSGFFVWSGLNPEGLANNFPLYKFVVGLNHDTAGSYSGSDSQRLFVELAHDPEQRDSEAIELIRQRLSVSPQKILSLIKRKAETMWTSDRNQPAFVGLDSSSAIRIGALNIPVARVKTFFIYTNYLYFILLFSLCVIASVNGIKGKTHSFVNLFITLFGLAVIAFVFIEVQGRYGYFTMPAVFMIAAPGLSFIDDRINRQKANDCPENTSINGKNNVTEGNMV